MFLSLSQGYETHPITRASVTVTTSDSILVAVSGPMFGQTITVYPVPSLSPSSSLPCLLILLPLSSYYFHPHTLLKLTRLCFFLILTCCTSDFFAPNTFIDVFSRYELNFDSSALSLTSSLKSRIERNLQPPLTPPLALLGTLTPTPIIAHINYIYVYYSLEFPSSQ